MQGQCEYPHFIDKMIAVQANHLGQIAVKQFVQGNEIGDEAHILIICPGYKILALPILPHDHLRYQGSMYPGGGGV